MCREVICSFPFISYAVDISLVTEPLPSYQQFPIVGFRGYESCTRCLATARLEHIYISSDIWTVWAECHIYPCLYSSLYLYNQVKEGNETIPFTER
jgi:hypothetical protein